MQYILGTEHDEVELAPRPVASGSGNIEVGYAQPGFAIVDTSSPWYPWTNCTLTSMRVSSGTVGTQTLTVQVWKNGSSVAFLQLLSGMDTNFRDDLSIPFTPTDRLNVRASTVPAFGNWTDLSVQVLLVPG